MKAAIGIDIGGTKVSVTLGTERGRIFAREQFPTPRGKSAPLAVKQIAVIIAQLLQEARRKKLRVMGIGIGVPGAINSHSGRIPKSPNLPGWENLPLKSKLEKTFNLPVYFANDANAAACAEKIFGTAKKASDFVYITVSTGIGGGIFVNHRLVEGAGFAAGEIGHIPVVPNGNLCGCGRKGCLEAHASGTAVAKIYTRLTGRKINGAKEASELAAKKNPQAMQAFKIAARDLGTGLAIVMNTLNPEMIVLGGGVWKSAPGLFFKDAVRAAGKIAWPEAFKSCTVKKSILRGEAGDLGALSLVFLGQVSK